MTALRQIETDAAIGVAIVEDPIALDGLRHPGCAAAIWHRLIPPRHQSWLDGLDAKVLPRCRVILRPSAVADTVRHLCDMAGLPTGPDRDWLEADIARLADSFADMMSAEYLRLRLDVVTNNACRRFHVDAITARLVCTYRGTGTQYGNATDGHDPEHIFTVPTGAPIVMRGKLWPEQPASGLLHRSPPIEGSGETRLLLVLDPVFDPEDEE